MVKAFAEFGLDGRQPPIPLTVDSPLEERLAFAAMTEEGMGAIFDAFAQASPEVTGVTTTTTTPPTSDASNCANPSPRQG
jgi:hypothetical protein